jgi:hypothetical protein
VGLYIHSPIRLRGEVLNYFTVNYKILLGILMGIQSFARFKRLTTEAVKVIVLLNCATVQSGSLLLTFQKNQLPPSSG